MSISDWNIRQIARCLSSCHFRWLAPAGRCGQTRRPLSSCLLRATRRSSTCSLARARKLPGCHTPLTATRCLYSRHQATDKGSCWPSQWCRRSRYYSDQKCVHHHQFLPLVYTFGPCMRCFVRGRSIGLSTTPTGSCSRSRLSLV